MSNLKALAKDVNAIIDQGIQRIPIRIPEEVMDGLGKIVCIVAATYSAYRKPKRFLGGASVGFLLSMRDFFDHPFKDSLKNKALLSPDAKDGMEYQKALVLLWIAGWNWHELRGFLAGHTIYHITKPQVDWVGDEIKKRL